MNWILVGKIQNFKLISRPLFHSHQDYVSANFYNSFNDVASGANLEYNEDVHEPGLAITTMKDVEQHWGPIVNSLAVRKIDSENHVAVASKKIYFI